MKPGDKVVDFLPGGGYYTRIFSKVVGPNGKVYAAVPAENMARRADADAAAQAIASDPAYRNVTVIHPGMTAFSAPEPVDIVWTSDNYHDMKNNNDVAAMDAYNKGVFNALKPGGLYFIVDHRAKAGSGFADTRTLHRIDPEALKAEVMKAGFKFDGESKALDRADDDLTKHSSFATSQFIYRFRKP
jgi:predicted methyltransferase